MGEFQVIGPHFWEGGSLLSRCFSAWCIEFCSAVVHLSHRPSPALDGRSLTGMVDVSAAMSTVRACYHAGHSVDAMEGRERRRVLGPCDSLGKGLLDRG